MEIMLPELEELSSELDIKDERQKTLRLMDKVLKGIPTDKGKKYALSKFLNDKRWGFDNIENFPNVNSDYWSLKHQEDYTPPDIQKTLEKRNKEQAENFWNWDSDEHWSKKGIGELKRQANDAGYGDNLAGYLDKVREVQTNKDRHKASEKYGYNYWGSVFAPRTVEAVQRGEDPSAGDIGLDAAENAMYLLNPAGRAVRAGLQGAKVGSKLYKYGKPIAGIADVLSNPLILETADANIYGDEDNTDRKNFNGADVLIGTGINAGMNKLLPMLWRNKDKITGPVQSKAQQIAEQEAKLATEEANKVLEDGSSREANERMKDIVQDELQRQRIRDLFATPEDKRELLKDIREQLAKNKVVEPRKTKFSERLLSDFDNLAALDYISNKTGDVISEDPKLSRRLIRGATRDIPLVPQIIGDLVNDYYNRKDKNEEQNKIDRDINALKLLGRRIKP